MGTPSDAKITASYVAMLLVNLAYGGSNILIKVSIDEGLNQLVLVVYRHIIGMLLLGPLAYVLERKQRPSFSISTMTKIFFLASIGTTANLNLFYAGLAYTSPTVAGALSNATPSLTFILAVLLRMEKVNMKSNRGRAKVFGSVICIGGSLILTFWKGPLFRGLVRKPLIHHINHHVKHNENDWVKGLALILTSHIAWSASLILQASVSKVYPAPLSLNAWICCIATLQSGLLALFFARSSRLWKLEWNVQLLTVSYCGFVNSAPVYLLLTWCINHNGPVFVAMFSPLLLVIIGLFSALAFAERLHMGCLIGAFLTIVGLYCVLWGKRKDALQRGMEERDENSVNEVMQQWKDPQTTIKGSPRAAPLNP